MIALGRRGPDRAPRLRRHQGDDARAALDGGDLGHAHHHPDRRHLRQADRRHGTGPRRHLERRLLAAGGRRAGCVRARRRARVPVVRRLRGRRGAGRGDRPTRSARSRARSETPCSRRASSTSSACSPRRGASAPTPRASRPSPGRASPLGDLGSSYIGSSMGDAINLGAAVSAFASSLGTATGASRILYAMGRDGFGPSRARHVLAAHGRPGGRARRRDDHRDRGHHRHAAERHERRERLLLPRHDRRPQPDRRVRRDQRRRDQAVRLRPPGEAVGDGHLGARHRVPALRAVAERERPDLPVRPLLAGRRDLAPRRPGDRAAGAGPRETHRLGPRAAVRRAA